MAGLSFLDAALLIPLLIFAFKGLQNGFMKEVFGFVGIVAAVFLAFRYVDALDTMLRSYFPQYEYILPIVSAVLIFLLVMVVANIIGGLLKKVLAIAQIGIVDHMLGALFGALKISILLSALLVFLAGLRLPSEETRQNSILYPYVIQVAPMAFDAVATIYPGAENFEDTIEKTIDDYNPLNYWYN